MPIPTSTLARTALSIAALLAAGATQAQTTPDGNWHGGISLGGAVSSGNTTSQNLVGAGDAVRETKADKISLYGLVNYAKSKSAGVSTTTADQLRFGGRYDYNLTDRIFVFGGAESETNKAGGLTSRYALNGGAGYKVIRTADTSFDVFGGLGYSGVKFTSGDKANGVQLLLGEESGHKLSTSTTFKQRFVFYPGQGDLGNLATFDAGLATAIAGGWTLNTGLAARYASKVPVGVKKTDTLFTVGFGYKF